MSLASENPPDWVEDREHIAGWQAERLDDAEMHPWTDAGPDGHVEFDDSEDRPWEIADDDAANWALRKIARAQFQIERLRRSAEHEIAQILRWRDEATGPHDRSVRFFESKLIDYRRRLEAEQDDLPKTYQLPGGDLTRRAGRSKALVTDEAAFVEWALNFAPEALAFKPLTSPITRSDRFVVTDSGAVAEVATGEIVPGITVTSSSDVYAVKVR